jgi:hypothetical protein
MNETNGRNGEKGGIRSLGELPRDIAPPRDLWPSIAAQLEGKAGGASPDAAERRSPRPTGLQWAALAAVVSALAVGIWLGRSVLPGIGGDVQPPVSVASNNPAPAATSGGAPAGVVPAAASPGTEGAQVFTSTYVIDPRYVMQREAMIRDLDAKLDALPGQSREKVAASLANIRDAMKDIEAELGRDPANALLQELLVNTFQAEMRLLTAVNEASRAGQDL